MKGSRVETIEAARKEYKQLLEEGWKKTSIFRSYFQQYFYMEFLTNLWNNQPTIVMGGGAAIVALIGIYITMLQKYQQSFST